MWPASARWKSLLQITMTYKWHFLNYCRFSPFLCLIVHPVCLCVFPLDIVAWWCLSVPKGRSGRSEDLAEEMDILPEGKNGLPSARVSAAVHYPGYVPLVWPPAGLEGLLVLRCLHTTVVRVNLKKRVFVRGRRVLLSLIVSGTPLGSFSVCVFQGHIRPVCSVCISCVRHQQSVCRGKVQDTSHRRNLFC